MSAMNRVQILTAQITSSQGLPSAQPEVFILSGKRTPIGAIGGSLVDVVAPELGSAAIKAALEAANVPAKDVQECIMGNVLSAGMGQAPARQAAMGAGLPTSVCCTTVNKVCASGMKAVTLAAQSILTGQADTVVAGGMESMSNVPYYVTGMARAGRGLKYGDQKMVDGVAWDGLSDPWKAQAMGVYGDLCAKENTLSREEQDKFASSSYSRSKQAHSSGVFKKEIVPISVKGKNGSKVVEVDEEVGRGKPEMFAKLRPAFAQDGTVTAASSSTISDGAAALVLASGDKVKALGAKPIAKVIAFADGEQEPERFTTAPAIAINKALAKANLKVEDIDAWEINEAFGVVVLANQKILGMDLSKINQFGGACSLGHPIGCSGARIVVTLCNVLEEKKGRYGVAAICNGGGGATAIIVERC
mmetsp:Transcript_50459/g.108779  ORF Transcript_50459/g.108779 Transcript_50459/m.108779 type:complete len:418 (+) Transcript_50459:177-1430(+)